MRLELNSVSSNCIRCGSDAEFLDGIYRFIDDVITVSTHPKFDAVALTDLKKTAKDVHRGKLTPEEAGAKLEANEPGLFAPLLRWLNTPVGAAYVAIAVTVLTFLYNANVERSNQEPAVIADEAVETYCMTPRQIGRRRLTEPLTSLPRPKVGIPKKLIEQGQSNGADGEAPKENRHLRRRRLSKGRKK
ncbi:hypothetical protein [Salipiger thiooxidans]|uniref:hypothetical protein n=1 Tax=Salipiger thiooxidans TaxID=282683 RepID=UPI001CD6ED45|nr:hypothetical protein [Salipiger thiooxidans]MCA0850311.1 hypothetical protein [Salipiger thiooxidans]